MLIISNQACNKSAGSGGNPYPPVNPPVSGKTFQNPLLLTGPDPFVTKSGSTYYYTNTLGDRVGIWKTMAMSMLSKAPYLTVFSPPSTGPNSHNLWAPEFYFINNKWFLYYTAGDGITLNTQRTFVLENDNADPSVGTWTDKGRIFNSSADFWAIDGTVLELNNIDYFIWSGHPDNVSSTQNIYISKMKDPLTLEGNRVLLSTPQFSWETNGNVNEGPEIVRNPQGKIFLVFSADGCWTDEYGLGLLSLKDNGDPLNPADWTKSATPVFMKSVSNNVYGPGHNSFFKSPDGTEDWIIYHANPMPENGQGCGSTRSTRMQKFTWNADGTPNFGVPVSLNTTLNIPSGE
ncbi:MAG: glycoside hydrolase family 43 protein [Chitinophagaceae bacterium]|nr:glycoside hydrolase family 43 protein [Chitinophagaceae bacterium]